MRTLKIPRTLMRGATIGNGRGCDVAPGVFAAGIPGLTWSAQLDSIVLRSNPGREGLDLREGKVATPNKLRALLYAGLGMCNVFVATSAQAQGVSFVAHRDFGTDVNPVSVAVGDFNGDGVQDLAVANFGPPTVSVLLGIGNG